MYLYHAVEHYIMRKIWIRAFWLGRFSSFFNGTIWLLFFCSFHVANGFSNMFFCSFISIFSFGSEGFGSHSLSIWFMPIRSKLCIHFYIIEFLWMYCMGLLNANESYNCFVGTNQTFIVLGSQAYFRWCDGNVFFFCSLASWIKWERPIQKMTACSDNYVVRCEHIYICNLDIS